MTSSLEFANRHFNATAVPAVSIGLPVYNGAETIADVLECLVTQTFENFELIISDNASTDETEDICRRYLESDQRIHYIRQPRNIGAEKNFRYVFESSKGEYFMWAASDDIRSNNYIEHNLIFLRSHPDYVASTSPVHFRGNKPNIIRMGDAALVDDDPYLRLINFFVLGIRMGVFIHYSDEMPLKSGFGATSISSGRTGRSSLTWLSWENLTG